MSRSNRKIAARERARFTGEKYGQALHAIEPFFGTGQTLIPDAQHADQQWAESALLHRLLLGARSQWPADIRPAFPLFVEAVYPLATGLQVVVPVDDVLAFGATLAMRRTSDGVLLPTDEVSIHCASGNSLRLTAAGVASGVVGLRCSWRKLATAVAAGPYVSAHSGDSLRFASGSVPRLSPGERAVLSGLLRRIALFVEPIALDWLFGWHEWIIGRTGATPQLPAGLVTDLSDECLGSLPAQLRTLGLDNPARSQRIGRRNAETKRRDRNSLSRPEMATRGLTPTGAVPAATTRRYSNLVVTAMRLDSHHPITREYPAMRFPRQWVEPLSRLLKRADGDFTGRVPIVSLNDAITAVLPDCVVIQPDIGGSEEDSDWLLAYQPIDPQVIFRLVTAWVRAQKATPEQIESTLSQLSPTDLSWSSVRIGPDLPFSLLARLIPMDVAATLSRSDAQAPIGNLRFVRCPTDDGAELMSWPPQQVNNGEPFSVTIGVSTQTVPFSSEPLVYLSFGIRRWMPAQGNLAHGQTYPVYLASTRPYLPGLPPSPHFSTAKIKRVRVPDERGRTSAQPGWHEALARILDHAGCLSQLPDPEQLVAKPLELLQQHGEAAALAFRTGMFPWPKVSEGLPVMDRAALMSWTIGELAPHLQPVRPLLREKHTIYKGLAKATKSVIPPEAIHDALGPRLTVELLTASDSTAQYALDRLGERLGVEFPRANELGDVETLLDLGPVTIGVRHVTIPSTHKDPLEGRHRRQIAVEAQASQLAGSLAQTSHPTIALVELSAPDHDTGRNHNGNLKRAVRQKLTRTGRLSQFVASAVAAQNEPHLSDAQEGHDPNPWRFSAAIDDLFRQLGVRPAALPPPEPNTLAGRPALLAIWLARPDNRSADVRNHVPVAVLADTTGQQLRVCTPTIDWQPWHAGLLAIGRQSGTADLRQEPQATMRFIKKVIEEAIADYPDTLLLTHEQNLRAVWTFLANSHLEIDTVQFEGGWQQPITTLPGLRHVRVRTFEHGETPESYGINGDHIGQPTGLWRYMEPRSFTSTTGKPPRAASASISVSKIEPGIRGGKLTRLNPKAQVWNERMVELCVAGIQDGDQPAHWAALVHNLRDATPYTHWSTELPWPLHLAKQIEEYIPHAREDDDLPRANA